jgi:hypothetical protein
MSQVGEKYEPADGDQIISEFSNKGRSYVIYLNRDGLFVGITDGILFQPNMDKFAVVRYLSLICEDFGGMKNNKYLIVKKQSSAIWSLLYMEILLAVTLLITAIVIKPDFNYITVMVSCMFFICTCMCFWVALWKSELLRSVTYSVEITEEQLHDLFEPPVGKHDSVSR